LYTLLDHTGYIDQFKRYRLKLFSKIQQKLGWDAEPNENPLFAMLRPIVLNIVGKSGDESVVKEAQKRFERHLNGDLIDPNIRGTVYALVARFGNEQTQEQLKKLYLSAEMTEEKVRVLRAMGQTIDPNLIQKALEFVFETEHVRMQDSTAGLSGCTSSRIGRELSWKYLQNNWSKLLQRFGDKSSYLIYFVEVKFGLKQRFYLVCLFCRLLWIVSLMTRLRMKFKHFSNRFIHRSFHELLNKLSKQFVCVVKYFNVIQKLLKII